MGREARTPRSYYTEDATRFQRRHPLLFPFVAFVVGIYVALTTGISPISRLERFALWLLIADLIWRFW